ncbi:MAG TPA: ABC transporter permease/substrate-binding protein, partial [Vicinamibacteria bacterium]
MGLLRFLAERRSELLLLTGQHVLLVLVSAGIAVAIGVPVGIALARRPRLARPVLALANLAQTIPSLALFGFLIPVPFIGGIGVRTAIVALVLYSLLPILRNTVTGIQQVDPAVLEAATGMGMTARQRLRLVELPLALPVILAGVRVAAVVSVGTATIAAAIGAGGLGTYVFRGLATVDTRLILAGAIPAALLALTADGVLGTVQKSSHPGRAAALIAVVAASAVAFVLLARSPAGARPVIVGSKNFTEQVLLGEILGARLEARGFAVDRRLNLGGTSLCHAAVRAGQIDVYVEYSGTALTDILKRPVSPDPAAVLRTVREDYRGMGLRVGSPLGFNNSYALAMRRADAEARGIRRISDIAPHAATLRVGLFGEFLERPDGMPGLLRAYGLRFGVPPREMDLGLLYQALA